MESNHGDALHNDGGAIHGRRYGDVELAFDVAVPALEQVLGGTPQDVDILRDRCSFAGPVIAVRSSLVGTPR